MQQCVLGLSCVFLPMGGTIYYVRSRMNSLLQIAILPKKGCGM